MLQFLLFTLLLLLHYLHTSPLVLAATCLGDLGTNPYLDGVKSVREALCDTTQSLARCDLQFQGHCQVVFPVGDRALVSASIYSLNDNYTNCFHAMGEIINQCFYDARTPNVYGNDFKYQHGTWIIKDGAPGQDQTLEEYTMLVQIDDQFRSLPMPATEGVFDALEEGSDVGSDD